MAKFIGSHVQLTKSGVGVRRRTRRTVYMTPAPPGAVFPSSIARQPTECQYRTMRLRKALGDMFFNADPFDTDTIIPTVEIINTSHQTLPFGSGDYPDKLLFHQALNKVSNSSFQNRLELPW